MKKILVLSTTMLIAALAYGQAGPQAVSLIVNGGDTTFYSTRVDPWWGNPVGENPPQINNLTRLDAANLGAPTSLVLDGAAAVSWGGKGDDDNVFNYRVYKLGTPTPAYSTFAINIETVVSGSDKRHEVRNKGIDLLALATGGDGLYVFEAGVALSGFNDGNVVALSTLFTVGTPNLFPITLKVIDYTKGEQTDAPSGAAWGANGNIVTYVSALLQSFNPGFQNNVYGLFDDTLNFGGSTPMTFDKGLLTKDNEKWVWQVTFDVPPGNHTWNPYKILPSVTSLHGALNFSVSAGGIVTGITSVVLGEHPDAHTVTLKVIDYTKGASTNALRTWAADGNIYARISDNLRVQNQPSKLNNWNWVYGMFNTNLNFDNNAAYNVTFPNGLLVKGADKWVWQISFQALPGDYTWNPMNILSGWKYWAGEQAFSVLASGDVAGSTSVIVGTPPVAATSGEGLTATRKLLVNFQHATESPITGADVRGNYWNNVPSNNNGSGVLVGAAVLSLVDAANAATPFKFQITKRFTLSNNGNFALPDAAVLGDLAVGDATKSNFYVDNGITAAFKIKGLNPQNAYKFHIFGTRSSDNPRVSLFTFHGLTTSYGTHTPSGAGIGTGGVNYNTDSILVSKLIYPNADGEITVELVSIAQDFAYIGAMKIEEYSDAPAPPFALNQKFYFDFGRADVTNGNITAGADVNGNYWNNPTDPATGATVNLVNSNNAPSPYTLVVTAGYGTNGRNNGALLLPVEDMLGDLAIATATEDYFFTFDQNRQVKITNLNVAKGYKFYIFGSRTDAGNRYTTYTLKGEYTFEGKLRTTGSDIGATAMGSSGYNANTSGLFISDILRPDANGEISITTSHDNCTYFNVMKIEEYGYASAATPTITVQGAGITVAGKTLQMEATVSPNYFPVLWSVDNSSAAWIGADGVLHPVGNGTVNVTGAIVYGADTITSTAAVAISNQPTTLYLAGTAAEHGDGLANAIPLRKVADAKTKGVLFEVYTELKAGTFKFYTSNEGDGGTAIGGTVGSLVIGGDPIAYPYTGTVRIVANLNSGICTITPMPLVRAVGNATPGGWSTAPWHGLLLDYAGDGVWQSNLTFPATPNDGSSSFIILTNANDNWEDQFKQVVGSPTNEVMIETEAIVQGITVNNFPLKRLGGEFTITLDARSYTYSIVPNCGDNVNPYTITVLGSSTPSGTGATSLSKGYISMFGQMLGNRKEAGLSPLNWEVSNTSVGGNSTVSAMERWTGDVAFSCGSYLMIGLTLGNEEIRDYGQARFDRYRDNLLLMVDNARAIGKTPVVTNPYVRNDFIAADYAFTKQMGLLMHEWDVPTVNLLGAVDDLEGKWAAGYFADALHPNDAGHAELYHAIVPSLFDALAANKPQPVRNSGTSLSLGKNVGNQVKLVPEDTVHSFTFSVDFKTNGTGVLASFETATPMDTRRLVIGSDGKLVYSLPTMDIPLPTAVLNDNAWYRITLTHYYAKGKIMLYVNNDKVAEADDRFVAQKFYLSDANAPDAVNFRELFFWRSAMNAEEIAALNSGKMLKSSLEVYAPLGVAQNPLVNLAQSTNVLQSYHTITVKFWSDAEHTIPFTGVNFAVTATDDAATYNAAAAAGVATIENVLGPSNLTVEVQPVAGQLVIPSRFSLPALIGDTVLHCVVSQSYPVTVKVEDAAHNPVAGLRVVAGGNANADTVLTTANGTAIFNLPLDNTGITLSLIAVGYDVAPAQPVTLDIVNKDTTVTFTATLRLHNVSVKITDEGGNVLTSPNFTVNVTGSQTATLTTASGLVAVGQISELQSITLTAAAAHYDVLPAQVALTTLLRDTTVTFTATLRKYNITVQVKDAAGALITTPAFDVAVTGGLTQNVVTAGGTKTFNDLPEGSAVTIVVSAQGYTVEPASRTIDNLTQNETLDFTATPIASGIEQGDGAAFTAYITQDVLYIVGDFASAKTVKIVDVSGKVLLSQPFRSSISVAHLPAGIYFVALQNAAGEHRTAKVLKP
jgi:hypothetical protein